MDMDLHSLIPLLPELLLLLAGCAILVLDLFPMDRQRDLTYVLSLVALAAAAAAAIGVGGSDRELVMRRANSSRRSASSGPLAAVPAIGVAVEVPIALEA